MDDNIVLTRLKNLEDRVVLLERNGAVDNVHRTNVEKRLESIESSLSRLMWIVIGTLVGGVLTFIIRGGLNGPLT